ncbi:MAG TPA: iron ABC transporter permease [Candidatus Eremiobacteraceae bacterium]|nr:iron ABC transporter permease [Candidatus Eremiobacteraceae bacterium]
MQEKVNELSHPSAVVVPQRLAFFRARDLVQLSIAALVVLFLIYQVITPLVFLVWGSLKTVRPGAAGFFSLDFTSSNYVRAFSQGQFISAVLNSVLYSTGAASGALFLATFLAWITERTDTPARSVIYGLSIVGLVIPGILTVVSWIFLASPNIGLVNVAARAVGFTEPPFDIFTLGGMIWVSMWQYLPLAFLLMSAAFQSMDPALEEASATSGHGVIRTTLRITLPLALPSILAVLVLLLITGLEAFETPALLGLSGKVLVFSTLVYLNTSFAPSDIGLASAYAVFMLIISIACLYWYMRMTRRERAFATITGKGFRPRRIGLGRWRLPIAAVALLILGLGVIVPLLVLLWASFLRFFQPPSLAAIQSLKLVNYERLLASDTARWALRNSLILGVASATSTVFFVSLIAWIVARTKLSARKLLDFLAFVPIAIPGIVLGISMIWLYLSFPLPIYGTLWIIWLAYMIKYMPVVMRIMSAAIVQIHPEMEEASALCAPWLMTLRRVLFPLLRPGLVAGWIWVMSHAFRELNTAILLANQETRPVGVAMYALWNDGAFGALAAFGVIVSLVVFLFAVVANIAGQRYGLKVR